MIPEKLESKGGRLWEEERCIGDIYNIHCKEIATEIVRRYNGYADQQKLIEQLVEAIYLSKDINFGEMEQALAAVKKGSGK
jgi:hypothetical protein